MSVTLGLESVTERWGLLVKVTVWFGPAFPIQQVLQGDRHCGLDRLVALLGVHETAQRPIEVSTIHGDSPCPEAFCLAVCPLNTAG